MAQENFEKIWRWLYPVAFTLTSDSINTIWNSTSPKWIEGFITKEEAELSLQGPRGLQEPGTFVLRFPTSRSWPHPDAGCLIVTYVGSDYTVHHRLLSLDYIYRCVLPFLRLSSFIPPILGDKLLNIFIPLVIKVSRYLCVHCIYMSSFCVFVFFFDGGERIEEEKEALFVIDLRMRLPLLCPCSCEESEMNGKSLEDMLFAEPELSRLGRQDILFLIYFLFVL
jgi:hypothetical protein